MAVSIVMDELTKVFGETRAVDHISMTINPGEIFFLLGPSGCGKTTLLRCVAGFYYPDHGRLLIDDKDMTRIPPHQRDTGMVFQSYALWPHMSVRENVAFGLEQRNVPKASIQERVAEALETVQMSNRADYKPNQLSGGQQQRVALARALVIKPTCLLLDEPLSNLDAKLRLEMRTEIRRICKQAGLTTIYVTHDQKEALSIADRIAILEGGHIRQCGGPREVYERPASRFVAHFIGETNFIEGTLSKREETTVTVETPFGSMVSRVFPEDVQEGETVTLSIRPEVIHLSDPPTDNPNQWKGMVHDSVYLGEVAQHQVHLSSQDQQATELKVFELNPKIVARDERTQEAPVWFNPEDIVVLKS